MRSAIRHSRPAQPLCGLPTVQVHGGSTRRQMTLVAPRACTNTAEGKMYLSSRRWPPASVTRRECTLGAGRARPRPALLGPSDRLRPRGRRASARPHARGDTTVNSNPGFLGERGLPPHPAPDDDEVGIELFPTL